MYRLKTLKLSGLLLPLVLLGSACGDDASDDGIIDPDDTEYCGHACPDAPINLPEGGEIRVEYVDNLLYPPNEIRADGWFASAQDPEGRPFARDPSNWAVIDDTVCAAVTGKVAMPDMVPTSRTYRDVGDKLTFTDESGASFELGKHADIQSDTIDYFHELGYIADLDVAKVPRNSTLTVTSSNGDDFGPLVIPADYDVSFPDFTKQIWMNPGEDFPFIWDTAESPDPEFTYAFVVFADVIGPRYRCIGPNNGQMTIPAAVVDDLPDSGGVQMGVFAHKALAVDGRRVDKIGISCKEGRYARLPVAPL